MNGVWLPAGRRTFGAGDHAVTTWTHAAGTPLARVMRPWHDTDPVNDAFWGPSVHWNTYLGQYVMLRNRTRDEDLGQEGIYVSFSRSLDDPSGWSTPQRILNQATWYPQVMGSRSGQAPTSSPVSRHGFSWAGHPDI